jgi:hypothetical protein
MVDKSSPPDFNQFVRWLASDVKARTSTAAPAAGNSERYDALLSAARTARDESVRATMAHPDVSVSGGRHIEVLQLLAAADKSDASRPPELMTARGFRVTLAYDEGTGTDPSSICVLVRCPPELIESVQGETVFLWNGTERFELGQFDSDGKAVGTLPAGIEISLSDFTMGRVKLEEPPAPGDE